MQFRHVEGTFDVDGYDTIELLMTYNLDDNAVEES